MSLIYSLCECVTAGVKHECKTRKNRESRFTLYSSAVLENISPSRYKVCNNIYICIFLACVQATSVRALDTKSTRCTSAPGFDSESWAKPWATLQREVIPIVCTMPLYFRFKVSQKAISDGKREGDNKSRQKLSPNARYARNLDRVQEGRSVRPTRRLPSYAEIAQNGCRPSLTSVFIRRFIRLAIP